MRAFSPSPFSRAQHSGRLVVEVARHLVATGHELQGGLYFRTDRHGKRTARVKTAPGGWIQRTGNLAGENDFLALFVRMRRQGGGEERLRVRMQRSGAQR